MTRVGKAEQNMRKWLGTTVSPLSDTDPELAAIRDRLVYGEILDHGTLDDVQIALVTLAGLAASQTLDPMVMQTEAALRAGATPEQIKEALYQCSAYIGFPRVEAALAHVNNALQQAGKTLALAPRGTVDEQSRFRDGVAVQKQIFGAENIDKMQQNAPQGQQDLVTNYLSAFCFGDLYTRSVLDLKMRELITFSAIVALGGCDPQARAHAQANINVGASKQNLVDCLAVLLPYIGFPRTLNGLAAVNAAAEKQTGQQENQGDKKKSE